MQRKTVKHSFISCLGVEADRLLFRARQLGVRECWLSAVNNTGAQQKQKKSRAPEPSEIQNI